MSLPAACPAAAAGPGSPGPRVEAALSRGLGGARGRERPAGATGAVPGDLAAARGRPGSSVSPRPLPGGVWGASPLPAGDPGLVLAFARLALRGEAAVSWEGPRGAAAAVRAVEGYPKCCVCALSHSVIS